MNEVSIILNGTRYDLVEVDRPFCEWCEIPTKEACSICTLDTVFQKSTKVFER